jgi:hypothetical protein
VLYLNNGDGNNMTEYELYGYNFLIDNKIEMFCNGVSELLDKIHARYGDVDIVAYSFLPSNNILRKLKH